MKKKHARFVKKAKAGRPRTNHVFRFQEHNEMNAMIMGNVEKQLQKIHSEKIETWKQKAFDSWSQIEEIAKDSQPLLKLVLACFLDSKKEEILGIIDWGVGLIDSKKWTLLKKNEIFLSKIAKTKSNKYSDVIKAFSEDSNLDFQKRLKEELLAYHKDQEVFHWYKLGWEKYEEKMLNVEETLWNMNLCSIRAMVEGKVEEYRSRYPQYFDE